MPCSSRACAAALSRISEGKRAIGTGAELFGQGGSSPPAGVGLQAVGFGLARLSTFVLATEHVATNANWGVVVEAVCADDTP